MIGIDVSKWQGEIDWPKTRSAGAKWAVIKAGGGSSTGSYTDSQFARNANECAKVGIPQTYYWWLYPTDGEAQAKYFYNLVKDVERHPKLGLAVDYEDTALTTAQYMATFIRFYSKLAELGMPPQFFYSRASFMQHRTVSSSLFDKMDLWIARYIDAPAPWGNRYDASWTKPPHFKTWFWWQYSADGNRRGKEFGAKSADIDLNKFNGNWDEFIGKEEKKVEEKFPVTIKVTSDGVALYNNKDLGKIVGSAPLGTRFTAYSEAEKGGFAYWVCGSVAILKDHGKLI